jgi:hypothetical protein
VVDVEGGGQDLVHNNYLHVSVDQEYRVVVEDLNKPLDRPGVLRPNSTW